MKNYLSILILLLVTAVFSVAWKQVVKEKTAYVQPETMELVPMMRLLLGDIYTINEGIYTENYDLIERSGLSIANHPVMTESDKKLIQSTLQEAFKKFVDYDMVVHHHADSLAQAAKEQDMKAVLKHYRIVQQGCVDCHTDFRNKIMEARNE